MAASLYLARSARNFTRNFRCVAIGSLIVPSALPCATAAVPATRYATAVEAGSGGKHWKYERIVSVALVGLIPVGIVYPNPIVDYGLAITLPIHGHWGLESVLEDYVPQSLKKLAYPLLYCVSLATFAGLMYLNYSDVGICKAVKMIWSLK